MATARSKKTKVSSPVEEKPAEVKVEEAKKIKNEAPLPKPTTKTVEVVEAPKAEAKPKEAVKPKATPKKFEVGAKVRMPNGKDALIISLKDDIAKMKTELSSNKIYSQPLSNLELI